MPETLHPITHITDPLLLPWLSLYERAFPYNERELTADTLRRLQPHSPSSHAHMLALLDEQEGFAGLGLYILSPQLSLGYLYYLAVEPERRSQGLGARFYQMILDEIWPQAHLMVLEVEIPELAEDDEHRRFAGRRINFYRRLGARLLGGIHYIQSVGPHCPPTPMHLMFQAPPGKTITPSEAYAAVTPVFDEALSQVGELTWAE